MFPHFHRRTSFAIFRRVMRYKNLQQFQLFHIHNTCAMRVILKHPICHFLVYRHEEAAHVHGGDIASTGVAFRHSFDVVVYLPHGCRCRMPYTVAVAHVAILLMHRLRYLVNHWRNIMMNYPVCIVRCKYFSIYRVI